MSNIPKRLEQVIVSTQKRLFKKNQILPQKVHDGILVGNVKITSDGTVKNLWQYGELLYKEIHLNNVAIKLANMMALKKSKVKADELYNADQEYGKWFIDSQLLRAQYQRACSNQDHARADIIWARYCESRTRAEKAKNIAQRLAQL